MPKAIRALEELLVQAQERADRPMEVIARSRLAECWLLRRDEQAAAEALSRAEEILDRAHTGSFSQYRRVQARMAVFTLSGEALRDELTEYVRWADGVCAYPAFIDGCQLLADHSDAEQRIYWLERALEVGQQSKTESELGRICTALADALDTAGRSEEALEVYEMALGWHRLKGSMRDQVGACWAIGSVGVRLEDWPLARIRLEEGIRLAGNNSSLQDLVALSLAELAKVNEASGDVIEARRLVLRAVRLAREEDLMSSWPKYWMALTKYAGHLDLDV